MESTANLMIFFGICRKSDKFHGTQQNATANLETGSVKILLVFCPVNLICHMTLLEKIIFGPPPLGTLEPQAPPLVSEKERSCRVLDSRPRV